MRKQTWALLSTYAPSRLGNGIQQRIALLATALSEAYTVHLHLLSPSPWLQGHPDPELWGRLAGLTHWVQSVADRPTPDGEQSFTHPMFTPQQTRQHPMHLLPGELARQGITAWLSTMPCRPDPSGFDPGQTKVYDLGEVMSVRQGAFLDLAEDAGARNHRRREAYAWAQWEQRILPRFDAVALCSAHEATLLRQRHKQETPLLIWPNPCWAATRPSTTTPPPEDGVLLFVGELGYEPNEEAVRWLIREILPILRQRGMRNPLRVVGFGAPDWIKKEAAAGSLELVLAAEDLSAHYGAAAMVLVPLRHGAGTRLKILEAFAYGRPVVSTPKGAEGLEVEEGVHLLLADTPTTFADACERAKCDGTLLTRNAREWVTQQHHPRSLIYRVLGDLDAIHHRASRRHSS